MPALVVALFGLVLAAPPELPPDIGDVPPPQDADPPAEDAAPPKEGPSEDAPKEGSPSEDSSPKQEAPPEGGSPSEETPAEVNPAEQPGEDEAIPVTPEGEDDNADEDGGAGGAAAGAGGAGAGGAAGGAGGTAGGAAGGAGGTAGGAGGTAGGAGGSGSGAGGSGSGTGPAVQKPGSAAVQRPGQTAGDRAEPGESPDAPAPKVDEPPADEAASSEATKQDEPAEEEPEEESFKKLGGFRLFRIGVAAKIGYTHGTSDKNGLYDRNKSIQDSIDNMMLTTSGAGDLGQTKFGGFQYGFLIDAEVVGINLWLDFHKFFRPGGMWSLLLGYDHEFGFGKRLRLDVGIAGGLNHVFLGSVLKELYYDKDNPEAVNIGTLGVEGRAMVDLHIKLVGPLYTGPYAMLGYHYLWSANAAEVTAEKGLHYSAGWSLRLDFAAPKVIGGRKKKKG